LTPDATPLRQPKEDEEGAEEEAVTEHGGNGDVASAGAPSNNQRHDSAGLIPALLQTGSSNCPSLTLNPDANPLKQPKEVEEGAEEEAVTEHGGNDDVAAAGAPSKNGRHDNAGLIPALLQTGSSSRLNEVCINWVINYNL
jgi:hypothetical protein